VARRALFRRRRPRSEADGFVAWVLDEYGVELSFDENGLSRADDLADRLKHTSGERRLRIERDLTEFVAEVLRRRHGGTWNAAQGSLMLPTGLGLNVRAWIAKRLHFGRIDSLAAKARVAEEFVHPSPEPDWDPTWPDDQDAADLLANELMIDRGARALVDEALVEWLTTRKAVYQLPIAPRDIPSHASTKRLVDLRARLRSYSESADDGVVCCYALARRYKAQAWLEHWRFGRSLSGPSASIVDVDERSALRLSPSQFLALLGYVASAPQYRYGGLLDMLWRVERRSAFRSNATAKQRREAALLMLSMVSEAHAWSATKHVKRFLAFADFADPAVLSAIGHVESEHWAEYWEVLRRIIFCRDDRVDGRGVAFGREVLEWLDGSRGGRPNETWLRRRAELVSEDAASLNELSAWLESEGDRIRRDRATGEVIEPVARWMKGTGWHREISA
jgi:hypothetical protein